MSQLLHDLFEDFVPGGMMMVERSVRYDARGPNQDGQLFKRYSEIDLAKELAKLDRGRNFDVKMKIVTSRGRRAVKIKGSFGGEEWYFTAETRIPAPEKTFMWKLPSKVMRVGLAEYLALSSMHMTQMMFFSGASEPSYSAKVAVWTKDKIEVGRYNKPRELFSPTHRFNVDLVGEW